MTGRVPATAAVARSGGTLKSLLTAGLLAFAALGAACSGAPGEQGLRDSFAQQLGANKFVKEFPDAANGIIDCNHWFNPKDKRAFELKKRVEAKGLFFTYEIFNTYTAVRLLADAIERAKSADRAAIIDALEKSTFKDHFMPYGDTKFVNGQNAGAMPLMTQVVQGDIKVIVPRDYREVDPVFPIKA